MNKNSEEKIFVDFIENLVDYAPKDYDEGFGTVYERYVMDRYLRRIKNRYEINSVFEGPSDGITGIRGINSFPFADEGCSVVYFSPSEREIEYSRNVWNKLGSNQKVEFEVGKPFSFPFDDNSFDLVWNFCIVEHFKDPNPLVDEMFRVSKKYVLIMTQNVYNIGTIPHVIYHKIRNQIWNHGELKWMSFGGIERLIKDKNPNILEKGCIDVPLWPDTWDMPVRGIFKRVMNKTGGSWNWSTLKDIKKDSKPSKLISFFDRVENLPVPDLFKLPITHHLYVLCEKK